jgi:hypothetical protein
VPKIAINWSTTNDCYGAEAAVVETQDNFRFVTLAAAQLLVVW